MKRRSLILVALLVALGVMTSTQIAFAQAWSGAGRAKGVVKDMEGNPIKGASVELVMIQDRDTGPPALTTDKKGKFAMLGLKGGMWWVRVNADGFKLWSGPYEIFSHSAPKSLVVEMERLPEEVVRAQKQFKAQDRLDAAKELVAKGDIDGARAEYDAAISELDEQDHPVVLAVLANTYLGEGDMARAKEILQQSLAIDPDHIASLKELAAITAAEGDVDQAEVLLGKIPPEEVVHPNTTMNLGMAHYNKGEMKQAKSFLDRTVRDHPDVALAYYFRGLINLSLEPQAAKADFTKYVEMAPDSPQAKEAREYLGYLEAPAGE
jgi:tetratricopeptide (TPR) repeat protein